MEMELMLAFLGVHLGVNYAKPMTTLEWPVQSTLICDPNARNVVEETGLRIVA
jgi:hypothetical protein